MATVSSDVDVIRRQMAQIRRELHEDMQGVVAGAEAATDWQGYIRQYPWVLLGVAFALGYLIVPRRHRSVTEAVEKAVEDVVPAKLAARAPRGVEVSHVEKKEKEKTRAGLMGALFGMVVPVVTRLAQSYASHYLEQWMAQQGMMGVVGQPEAQEMQGGSGRPM